MTRSLRILVPALAASMLTAPLAAQQPAAQPDPALLKRALRILRSAPLIDGHNDIPSQLLQRGGDLDAMDLATPRPELHTDLARLRAGGVGAQFWSAYVTGDSLEVGALRHALREIDAVHRIVDRYPELRLARTADEIVRAHRAGRIASMIGVEGGHAIENSLSALRAFHQLGVRYMTLTHNRTTDWADANVGPTRHDGLSPFGEQVIREMNRLGMFVDLSHVSPATMHDALRVTAAPVIFSHSSARGVTDHPRNVPDDVLLRLRDNGGVVMVTFVPAFVHRGAPTDTAPRATLADVADHIDHIRRVVGVDHIGIGSDYDGISTVPSGLEDASTYPALFAELLRRGYSEKELKKIAGQNLLRAMRRMERVAADLQRTTPPSLADLRPAAAP